MKLRNKLVAATLGVLLLGSGLGAVAPFVRSAHILHRFTGKPITVPGKEGDGTLLFNGWRITPAGRPIAMGDFPLGGAISPDGKNYAIANCGYDKHTVHLIDLASEKEFVSFPINHAWNGIAWAPNSRTVYVSGGISTDGADIEVYTNMGDRWEKQKTIALTGNDPKKTILSGLAISADGATLYALNLADGNLNILDTVTGALRGSVMVGNQPIVCRLTPNGKQLVVANWGGKEVVVVNVSDATKPTVAAHFATGDHPNDLALSSDNRLFVSCANSDAVYIHDATNGKPLEVVKTALTAKSPSGSTPNALALAPDNKTLYVANADANDVCVIDVAQTGKSHVRGFIPTGWYPTSVAVTPDGKRVLIGSGKGIGSHPNVGVVPKDAPNTPLDYAPADYKFEYIGKQLNGLMSFVDAPTDTQLATFTGQVVANTPYHDDQLKSVKSAEKTAIPTRVGDSSPIKHILYIIKENRTYDQVFGDFKQGNGDPNMTLFGRTVTPNHHALAEQFVLLDNLYCSGEVSADGHIWCDAAIATDFTQRDWVLSYSRKGSLGGVSALSAPAGGFLWDACKQKGLTYRSYGEGIRAVSSEAAPKQELEGAPGLIGHGSASYLGVGRVRGAKPKPFRDTDKADAFIAEFRDYDAKNAVPNFMIMSLGEDHTTGTRPGTFTPKAAVASNDLALGKIVDAISHTKSWKETAIFVIEDDAQNGPDHIDSHRTVGLVISPYTKRGIVDSTMYSTTSMVRSIELMLGLNPLTPYDAAATPMFASFTNKADMTPYTALAPTIDVSAINSSTAVGAAESSRLDFTAYDRANPDTLNRILWQSIKGTRKPMPAPVHTSALVGGTRRVAMKDND